MCHERFSRRREDAKEAHGERLWDLFYRETERPAPSVPIAEREEPDAEPEEILTGATRRPND
jgi:hypothetical protein